MKPKTWISFLIVVVSLFLVSIALAEPLGFNIEWWTVNGGGGVSKSTGGQYTLQGTIGQPDAGSLQGGEFVLEGGFWAGLREWVEQFFIHLPLVLR